MGLFQNKKQTDKDYSGSDDQERFFDETFREELKNHGRWYFEKVITENGALFREDLKNTVKEINEKLQAEAAKQLDEAIGRINDEVKQHLAERIEEQLNEYNKAMKSAQDVALQSVIRSAEVVRQQHEELAGAVQATITAQNELFSSKLDENNAELSKMKNAQDSALETITQTAKAMEEHYHKLSEELTGRIAKQEAMLIQGFEDNMSLVVEHYLLGALGEQYDLKAQLPSIIAQMEQNKQAIVDDMKA